MKSLLYHWVTKSRKSMEKFFPGGRAGWSSSRTFVSISKSVLQFLYGNSPVASSTCQSKRLCLGYAKHFIKRSGQVTGQSSASQHTKQSDHISVFIVFLFV